MARVLAILLWCSAALFGAGCFYGVLLSDAEVGCELIDVGIDPQVTRACVLRASCPVRDNIFQFHSITDCIEWNVPSSTPYDGCTANAQTCADIVACADGGLFPAEQCAGQSSWVCDGTLAILCGVIQPYYVNCARRGGICEPHGDPTSSVVPCRVDPGVVCDAAVNTNPQCLGNTSYACVSGRAYGVNCEAFGQICDPFTGACSLATVPCTAAGNPTCTEDGELFQCYSNGFGIQYDCAKSGGACAGSLGCNRDDCDGVGTSCFSERCLDATRARVCMHQDDHEINCADYGFTGCEESVDSLGNTRVRCI